MWEQPPASEQVLAALLNEIATIPGNFLVILDDYHLVDSRPVDSTIAYLLGNLTPGFMCRHSRRIFNEHVGTVYDRLQFPSDVICWAYCDGISTR
jgi:ATP/maltotriose-dependent transcriptional regulator MalT